MNIYLSDKSGNICSRTETNVLQLLTAGFQYYENGAIKNEVPTTFPIGSFFISYQINNKMLVENVVLVAYENIKLNLINYNTSLILDDILFAFKWEPHHSNRKRFIKLYWSNNLTPLKNFIPLQNCISSIHTFLSNINLCDMINLE